MHGAPATPHHGGRLRQAALHYDIPIGAWLDLSTGVNPHAYPHLDDLTSEHWLRLPEDDDGLAELAARHYGASHALPVAGSQAAIQLLPLLREQQSRVGVISPGYAEHAHAWQRHGHLLSSLKANEHTIDDAIDNLDVLLVINPNNPTGSQFTPQRLLGWHRRLASRGGWLVVDEAFADCTPQLSMAPYSRRDGLIVLRSLGKFYGLAGARVGFLLANPALLARAAYEFGPWTVSGPAREISRRALTDHRWQAENRARLLDAATRLNELLGRHGLSPDGSTALFAWLCHPKAQALYDALARRGILSRLFSAPSSLRFGLPADKDAFLRLDDALAASLEEIAR